MFIGKQVTLVPGQAELLVDEADFDGPITVILTGQARIGDATVTHDTGYPLNGTLTLQGVADSVYGTNINSAGNGGNMEVYVLAYSGQEG